MPHKPWKLLLSSWATCLVWSIVTLFILNTPDGLFLQGNTLYVTQNLPKSIAVVKLSSDFSQAALEHSISHPSRRTDCPYCFK